MDIREVNKRVIGQFRAGGEIEGMHRDRLLLLTTTGARTGREHTSPMMFHRDGDGRVLVIASNQGAAKDPDWFRNLAANPQVTVEIGDESYPATAVALSGTDRARAWDEIKGSYPFFADHEAKAGREIPVVALQRTVEH